MKKKLLLLPAAVFLLVLPAKAQDETWNFQGYSIGLDVVGAGNCQMAAMPDIIRINSTYYMYYVARYGNANAFYYATSPDMINWAVQDTIMTGSTDTTSRLYDLGGPGVMKLSNGNYRLFYRTSQKMSPPNEPLYHIRSMYSTDGIHFTHESGVRIENQTYQPGSFFKSASHPSVYKDINGNTRLIMTGRDTSMNLNSPAGLYTATSSDEGMTWSNFTSLYPLCHDPVVVRDSGGIYHMYTSYMGTGHWKAVSSDGISWPASPDSLLMMQGTTLLNEQTSPNIIADLGAGIKTTGEIVLYSNYKPSGPGAWRDIAYFTIDLSSGISNQAGISGVSCFPNPASGNIRINGASEAFTSCELLDIRGSVLRLENPDASGIIDISELAPGIYFLRLKGADNCPVLRFVKE